MRKIPTLLVSLVLASAFVAAPALAQLTISNQSFEAVTRVDNEPITLTGTNNSPFAHTPVVPQTIVVTNDDETVTYVHGGSSDDGDYRLQTGTQIRRTNVSTIPSGSTVLADYDYSIWSGWTPYGFVEGGTSSATPRIGTTGGESTLDVLFPSRDVDGYVVVGYQGWGSALSGGCYQTITADRAGFIVIKARAFSIGWNMEPSDIGNRVRAGLAKGTTTDRNMVYPFLGGLGFVNVAWGDAWNNIVVPVPQAGTYTLFIENYTPGFGGQCSGIWSSCWDWVAWSDGVVNVTSEPTVSSITETSATISWQTDVLSQSKVYYDTHGEPFMMNVVDTTLVTDHSITLTNLLPGTTYYLQTESASGTFTPGLSGVVSFTTMPAVQAELSNLDFEAVDGANNPTLAPWFKFGSFHGLFPTVANPNPFGVPAHGGERFVAAVSSHSTEADMSGVFQRVQVTPGNIYVARVWIFTENMIGSAENPVPGPGYDAQCRIGIDPNGGVDPNAADIVWSPWDNSQDWVPPYQQLGYKQIACIAEIPATSSQASIFLQVHHPWSNPWVKTAFDDVSFEAGTPCDDIACAVNRPLGWLVTADNGGAGYLVTKVEEFTELAGPVRYAWVQKDDRSAAFKVRMTDATTVNGGYVERGCRIGIVGRTDRRNVTEYHWGEAEIVADTIDIKSTGQPDPAPLGLTNRSLGGGPLGIQRGATGATGLNNSGLVVRTTGLVTEIGVGDPVWFLIDDGSNVPAPGTSTGVGVKVYVHEPFAAAPDLGQYVTVTGVSYLDVFDPTEIEGEGRPNGNGDEILIRSIRTRDASDIQPLQ